MCMSARPANFSATKIYAGEGEYKGKYVHVIAYQNNAKSQKLDEPNAMILPFPTSVAMTEKNVIDTRPFKNFMQDIAEASIFRGKTLGSSRGLVFGAAADARVFDVGSYTVVLAEHASQIPLALQKVSEDKRPALSYQLLNGLNKLYPNQPLAVCCWGGSVQAEPLLWWYEPKDKDTLFMPTMDAHDGGAPDVKATVKTDHVIMAGSFLKRASRKNLYNAVLYKNDIPKNVATLLPALSFGSELPHRLKNGDIFVKTEDLMYDKDGKFSCPIAKRGVSSTSIDIEIHMYG